LTALGKLVTILLRLHSRPFLSPYLLFALSLSQKKEKKERKEKKKIRKTFLHLQNPKKKFDPTKFPDPVPMLERFHELGLKVFLLSYQKKFDVLTYFCL